MRRTPAFRDFIFDISSLSFFMGDLRGPPLSNSSILMTAISSSKICFITRARVVLPHLFGPVKRTLTPDPLVLTRLKTRLYACNKNQYELLFEDSIDVFIIKKKIRYLCRVKVAIFHYIYTIYVASY